jgi:ATP/maltotriose-dependent transcriptional regulator MalT/DNA-binding SARP family transcriptional activator
MATTDAARIARPPLAQRLREGLEAGSVVLVAGPGFGKTMALEEAIALSGRRAIWLSCGRSGLEPGDLLMEAVRELRTTVPGIADVVGDALATATEPVDVRSATGALLAELERLLVEPLVIVLDDAEELERSAAALAGIEWLLSMRNPPFSLAIATRRPLSLKVAKLRASAQLLELGPAELAFSASDVEQLLETRHGRPVSEDEVAAVFEASEGWPMGVALTDLAGPLDAAPGAVSREELFRYLAEEIFDRLPAPTRLSLVDSSLPATLTPDLVQALGLAPDFPEQAERSGFFLRLQPSGVSSYHPLFREFLHGHLEELRTESEIAALHARVAESLTASGRGAEAIAHWLAAGRFESALAALASAGPELVRTSPGAVAAWLAALPAGLAQSPDYLFLEAQLLWGTGHHESALEPLRRAVAGFSALGDEERAWSARVFLADTLTFTGAFAEVPALAVGWEEVREPVAAREAMRVAWFEVVALSSLGRLEEADALRERLRLDPALATQFAFLDALARAGAELGAGRLRDALGPLRATVARLESADPLGRLPYVFAVILVVLRTLGERQEALEWIDRGERKAARAGLGFVLRDFWLQRAALLAQGGDLPRAEVELAKAARREGMGWRGAYEAEAEAQVALLRGETAAAATAARRALDRVRKAPMPWRVLSTMEMGDILVEAGAPDVARAEIERTLALLDDRFPGERGRLHRAWLLAARASVEQRSGEPGAACDTVLGCWQEAGGEADELVRAQWPTLRPVLWEALAEGALSADAVLPAVREAFPGGEGLVAMVDHPAAAVRRAALLSALGGGHPAVLDRLEALGEDGDEQVAAAAAAKREKFRSEPPPLRFELLGGFRVRRAGWEIDQAGWGRPMAARVVRFLLIQGDIAVPEDALFEAFWADRPADAARQHLAVAVSRARKVLDLPGAEQSAIELRERTYRVRLRPRDSVDAVQFEAAASAALADRGDQRLALLEHADELWTGKPLPEDRYAEWASAWCERLVQTHSYLLSALIDAYARSGAHDLVIRTGRRLLDQDACNEAAHRSLMMAYARTGRTSHALRQYLECRRALVVELGVEPSAETSGLQGRILAGEEV